MTRTKNATPGSSVVPSLDDVLRHFRSSLFRIYTFGIFHVIMSPQPKIFHEVEISQLTYPFLFLCTVRSSPVVRVINIAVKNIVVCKVCFFPLSEFMIISLGAIPRMNIF